MEIEPGSNAEVRLRQEAVEIIETEVAKDITPLKDEDPDTAELAEDEIRDYRTSEYLFLQELNETISPERVLYAGSGSDVIPKVVFGEDKVIHTSLEDSQGDKRYFPELGPGHKVIAHNARLPFRDSSFQVIILFGKPYGDIQEQTNEFRRVLTDSGSIVLDKGAELVDHLRGFENVEVPPQFQKRGVSETEFFHFRKTSALL